MPETLTGTVTRLLLDKGFGFIAATDQQEYFFHRSAVADWPALQEGDEVRFDGTTTPKGPRAEQVIVVTRA